MTTHYEDIANSPEGWVETFEILAKYMSNGMQTKFFLEAEHDVIYSHISADDVPANSEDGLRLVELGWHLDSDIECWAYFT